MKNILIPTDFSYNAWNALEYAATVFKQEPCQFFILNVYDMDYGNRATLTAEGIDNYQFEGNKEKSVLGLKEWMKKTEDMDLHKETAFHSISTLNDLLPAMQETVKDHAIDLVVMGTKGVSNYETKVYGSNAINTMEHMDDCPILSVPSHAEVNNIREIVLPTDYHIKYDKKHLDELKLFMQACKAELRVLHVGDDRNLTATEKENKRSLESKLQGTPHTFHHLSGSDVNETVRHFIDSRGSEMMAFGNKRHTFISKLFSSNMTMEFGMFSKVPLFVMAGN